MPDRKINKQDGLITSVRSTGLFLRCSMDVGGGNANIVAVISADRIRSEEQSEPP